MQPPGLSPPDASSKPHPPTGDSKQSPGAAKCSLGIENHWSKETATERDDALSRGTFHSTRGQVQGMGRAGKPQILATLMWPALRWPTVLLPALSKKCTLLLVEGMQARLLLLPQRRGPRTCCSFSSSWEKRLFALPKAALGLGRYQTL